MPESNESNESHRVCGEIWGREDLCLGGAEVKGNLHVNLGSYSSPSPENCVFEADGFP